MKVLFLTHRLPFAPNRGDRIRAYHILGHLSRYASVDLLSLVHDADEESAAGEIATARVHVVRTTPWRNRVRSAVRLATSTPLTHTMLDAPALEQAVAAMVRRTRPDVILAYCSGVARLALSDALKDIPLVLDMVDVDSAKWLALSRTTPLPLGWVYGREARCLGRFESQIVAHARTTLVVNERERRTLTEAMPGADIRTVANGIDLAKFRPVTNHVSEPHAVFCGVMNYQPNEEAALRLVQHIWPTVRAAQPNARLVIVGANPTDRLRNAASGDATISVTGSVPDVRPYLWNAAVSVAPLTTARGLQNKVLEALAADLPVVTTPAVAEGLPDSVMPGCVVAGNDAATADAIVGMLRRSVSDRRALARRADLSHLGWETQLAPLVPILEAAANAGRLPVELAS
jgi:polysaccharide biosynthesis protein PslH